MHMCVCLNLCKVHMPRGGQSDLRPLKLELGTFVNHHVAVGSPTNQGPLQE